MTPYSPLSTAHYQPRRPVPWRLADVALIFVFYFAVPGLLMEASRGWLGVGRRGQPPVVDHSPLDSDHPMARVLLESHNVWAIVLCALSAVVVAPLTEEVLFRLLLQGWLESLERRFRRTGRLRALAAKTSCSGSCTAAPFGEPRDGSATAIPTPSRPRFIAAGVAPVAISSIMFAALHIRGPRPPENLSTIIHLLGIQAVASLLTVALLICWLRFAVGATLSDLGIVPGKLAADVRLGLLALLAAVVPVYAVLIVAKQLLPEGVVADPIAPALISGRAGQSVLSHPSHPAFYRAPHGLQRRGSAVGHCRAMSQSPLSLWERVRVV